LCHFVESDSKAVDVVRANLLRTGLIDAAKVLPVPVARAIARLQGPYDLVVADPPYEYDRAERELAEIIAAGLVADGGTVVVEHSKRRDWPDELGGLTRFFNRRYGDTSVSMYGKEEGS